MNKPFKVLKKLTERGQKIVFFFLLKVRSNVDTKHGYCL